MSDIQKNAVENVLEERRNQDEQWGVSDHDPQFWSLILSKHAGRLTSKALDWGAMVGYDSEEFYAIMEFRDQAVKVAAIALAIVECIDRAEWTAPV